MNYRQEFRVHWRAMLGAAAGFSSGLSINSYINSVLGPYLLDEFKWTKAEFALAGTLSLLTLIFIPIAGRMTDLFGARRVASVGVVAFPLSFLLLATMEGDIRFYYAITVMQIVFCVTTTSTVYTRVVAERFSAARGLALALFACGPALVGAIGSPLLTQYMNVAGWRAGYIAIAVFSALAGGFALALLPGKEKRDVGADRNQRHEAHDYRAIARNAAFWIILTSTVLCSVPYALAASQIKVMLIEHDVSSTQAGFMVSVFAGGVIVGRFASGLALDRFPTHWVAAVGMGLPCIGLFMLASDVTALPLIVLAVATLGLSYGAEGDVVAYIAARYFDIKIFSTVLGLFMAGAGGAMTLGAAILSLTLHLTDSFRIFMLISGVSVLLGSLGFLRLKQPEPQAGEG
jgi:MFS family permease